ncbi:MAG: polysaccharide deacetylase family protein [Acidimicrobiales bacterium]
MEGGTATRLRLGTVTGADGRVMSSKKLFSPRTLVHPTRLVRSAAVPAAAHLLPSVLVLGQWWPAVAPPLRALPGGLCRWRGPDTGRPEVSLTFDDGPDPSTTPKVLDFLDEASMRGTFFCLGGQVERHPDLTAEIKRRGHEVAVHGFAHQRHLVRSAPQLVGDLQRALDVIEPIAGRPRHFRPPYGQVSGGSILAAHRCGLDMVLWSAWGREWADRSADSVAERVIRRLEKGTIVLLHDSDRTSPVGTAAIGFEALRQIVDHLDERNMKSVRLVDLVKP